MWLNKVLPWLVVAVVWNTDRWFPSLYRALPPVVWVLAMAVGFVFGVWRWIAFFVEKRAER